MGDIKDDNVVDFSSRQPAKKKEIPIDKKDLTEIVKKVTVEYDSSKLTDLQYIFDIFSPEYDKFKSSDFIQKTHKELLKQGYPQTPALNEYLFWTTISRRMHILYQEYHKQQMKDLADLTSMKDVEDIDFLESMQSVAAQITVLQKSIDSSFATSKQGKDVVDLHKETCEKAVKWLEAHFGEYVKVGDSSEKIADMTDKAHWAFVQDIVSKDDGQELITHVWSEEMKYLVDEKIIPIELMAFALRTSIEGLCRVSEIRGKKLIIENKELAEKNLRNLMLPFEQVRYQSDKEVLAT